MEACPDYLEPMLFGLTLNEKSYIPITIDKTPAPLNVIKLSMCSCEKLSVVPFIVGERNTGGFVQTFVNAKLVRTLPKVAIPIKLQGKNPSKIPKHAVMKSTSKNTFYFFVTLSKLMFL